MRATKDSGISWLGEYPSDWELKKIKYCLQERVEKNNPVITTEILSLTAKQGVIPYDQKEGGGNKPKEDVSAYRLAYPGDIVMNSMNILSGSVGLSQYFGCVSSVYYMLRPWKAIEDVRYYNYIFQTTMFQRSLFGLGNGILIKESGNGKLNTIRMRIPMDKFGGLFIPVAPIDEQKRIADFLDAKCAEIDALVADIQTQIDTLEQYKRSVITETVTKGLNPNAEMKDSGIEWVGQMPLAWDVVPNKYLMYKVKNICPVYNGEDILSLTTNGVIIRDLNGGGKMPTSFDGYQKVTPGNLLMCLFDIDVTPRCIGLVKNFGLTSPAYSQFVMRTGAYAPYYYYYYLMVDYTKELLHMAKNLRHSLTEDQLGAIKAPNPPCEEQVQIAEFLDKKCVEISRVIEDKNKQLATLDEYKKSLIFEYVTGKKEVPLS